MRAMFYNKFMVIMALSFVVVTTVAFLGLISDSVLADDVIDDVSIRVQISCTMNGSGTNTHNATVNPGTYETNIGLTTFNVFCNDNDGFAIYAIGYTDNTDGKNVLTDADLGSTFDITTGTGTTGTSQWAMKLVTDAGATYPITLQNGFGSWHTVPSAYTLVAKRTADTDVGVNATGASFTSTYQVFASSDQPAGNYNGRVKYVMVHPNDTSEIPVKSNQIGVIFDGNGLTFSGGASENRVVYDCATMYQGTAPTIVKSSNVADDGTEEGIYEGGDIVRTVSFNGADKVLVEVRYGLNWYDGILVVPGEWDGMNVDGEPSGKYYQINYAGYEPGYGTETYVINDDAVSIEMRSYGGGSEDYSYGMYAVFSPLYYTNGANTEEAQVCGVLSTPANGAYATTTNWQGKWYLASNDDVVWFNNVEELLLYLQENESSLVGTTVYINAYNQYKIAYNGNGATGGTMSGYYTRSDFVSDAVNLTVPNFYKSNYGFAGWSEDQNATVNGSSKIYGPNEYVVNTDLDYDYNTHEATLYAVWVPSAGNLQGWNGCSSLGQGRVTALTDTRDNQTYAVAKLADGNCWMIENLRLDAANSSDSSKAQGFGGVFSGLANSESSNFSNTTTSNSKYSTSNITGSNQAYRIPRYNNSNTTALTTSPVTSNDNIYGYGNYYNWAAAIANTTQINSSSATTSLCPSGWALPRGGGSATNSNDYYRLTLATIGTAPVHFVGYWSDAYDDDEGTNAIRVMWSFPNNYVLSGAIHGSSFYQRGFEYQYNDGLYNASGVRNDEQNYAFRISYSRIDGSSVSPVDGYNWKYYGNSIRCVFDN